MKQATTYMELYNQCMKTGKMPENGLCNALPKVLKGKYFELIKPTDEDFISLLINGEPGIFWGRESMNYRTNDFTHLRQTLVLLMAALNNEL